jgi:cellulose synthase/poly-beta-1,6-N-acetylglucosamine synthase-like glycosyltransferase
MDRAPAISIVIPLYNKEADILRSIKSVHKQTITDWELVVVNDGSTDKGPEIARSVNDRRIRIIDQANQGVSAARNKGIDEARADLIAFLDADDEWEHDYLETIMCLRDKFSDCDVYATSYYIAHADGNRRKAILRGLQTAEMEFKLANYFEVAVQSDPPLWTSAVAVSKKAIQHVGGFHVGVTAGEDLLTWARLALKFNIAYSTDSHATFYSPVFVSDRPSRLPQCPDLVGDELANLLANTTGMLTKGLPRYISLWHRMRAVVYLQVGRMADARNEIKTAIRYSGSSPRLIFLLLLSYLPYGLSMTIFKKIKQIKEDNR